MSYKVHPGLSATAARLLLVLLLLLLLLRHDGGRLCRAHEQAQPQQ